MQKVAYYLNHPRELGMRLLVKLGRSLPDKTFLKIKYWLAMGKRLNLQNPTTFSEKLQWLKLYDRQSDYTMMVDKVKVKEHVASILGEDFIIPTLGVWDNADKVDFDSLPNKFVIKCNHNSGLGMFICKDKSKMDIEAVRRGLKRGLRQNYFIRNREWPYKDVPRRIIAEQYIDPAPDVSGLVDYKWYCFNGTPKYCHVIQDRTATGTSCFFDTEWQRLSLAGLKPETEQSEITPQKPDDMETQIKIARHLSKEKSFSCIDVYHVGEDAYYGEITLFSFSGQACFNPEDYHELMKQLKYLSNEHIGAAIIRVMPNGKLKVSQPDLPDYKFFCFNGEPYYCQVISGRNERMCVDFFDKEWRHQPFHEPKEYPFSDPQPERPKNYDRMWQAAKALAKNKPFSRIDFYHVRNHVYFGEITFYPTTGMGGFEPEKYDTLLGQLITLPE